MKVNHQATKGFGLAIAVGLVTSLVLAWPVFSTVSVTVVNESSYPWLVAGAYADYRGEVGGYVMPNGTLLLNLAVSNPSPNTPDNMTLDWTVLNRTGDMAWLHMQYRASGCDVSQEDQAAAAKSGFTTHPCTKFAFSTALSLEVNVTSGEAYNGTQPIGLLNFWAPPLISSATTYGGTAFVDGVRQDVLMNVTGPTTTSSTNCSQANPCSELGGPEGLMNVNESGISYAGPFTFYNLRPANIGQGSNQTTGWLKVTEGFQNGQPSFNPMPSPVGTYNYYSGLALMFSAPEYPVQTWVCGISHGTPTKCEFTTYSTTLGALFRSEGGFILQLVSTNIPIKPSQTSYSYTQSQLSTSQVSTNQAPSGFSLTTLDVVGIAVAAVVVVSLSAVAYRLRARRQHPQR